LRISTIVDALAADLEELGTLGDEAMAVAAHRLAGAMRAPVTARLLEALGQAAAELAAALPDQRAEVRLLGDDAQIVVSSEQTLGQPEPPPVEEAPGAEARITLRLPAQLKARIEVASNEEGVSVNTYVVRVLNRQAGQGAQNQHVVRVGRRLSGYGRS
jgi:hypothetical protein